MQIFEKIVENIARESNTTPENVLQNAACHRPSI